MIALFSVFLFFISIIVAKLIRRSFSKDLDSKFLQAVKDANAAMTIAASIGYIVIPIVCTIIFVFNTYVVINAGEVGVQKLFGSIQDEELREGLHFVNPLSSITEFDITLRTDNPTYVVETIDTQTFEVPIVYAIYPDPDYVAENFRKNGSEFVTKAMKVGLNEAIRGEIGRHKLIDIVKERPNVQNAIVSRLREHLAEFNITLDSISLGEFNFSDGYDRAIEAKQLEEQKAAQRKYELMQHEIESQSQVVKAKALADSAIEKARGEAQAVRLEAEAAAEALRIKGEAQAQYNRLLAESMSPALIEYNSIQRWDGKLPTFMGIPNNTLMNLPIGTK